ncbi:hypothetical protein GCM10019060_28010 [Novosphingobium pokkalii]|nr:hypothetical protein GCM10019060_28010 [Novosphingobium pokkalii]
MRARTVAWYSSRYGDAMNRESGQIVNGCTMVFGTPFVLHVPLVAKRTGTPGGTIWICFPKEVEDDEDELAWIEGAPNIASLLRSDGMKARRLANEVAGAIRSIQTALTTIEEPPGGAGALRDAIVHHLDTAEVLIAKGRTEQLKHAQWDSQMACEKALKLLSEQRHATSLRRMIFTICSTSGRATSRSSGCGWATSPNGSGWPSGATARAHRFRWPTLFRATARR